MIEPLAAKGVPLIEIHYQEPLFTVMTVLTVNTVHHCAKKCQDGKIGTPYLCD